MKNVFKVKGATKNPYRARMLVNGVRKSKNFPTKEAAQAQLRVWKSEALDEVSSEEIAELMLCRNKLAGKGSLTEAVEFFLRHGIYESESPTIRDGVKIFAAWLEESGRTRGYCCATRSILRPFVNFFGESHPGLITVKRFSEWVRQCAADPRYSARTKHNQVRSARNFLGWARAQGWCENVPVADERLLPRIEAKEPEYYSAAETRRLFAILEEQLPNYVLHFAVRAFLGLRTSEANRLTWDDVDLEHRILRVRAKKTKLGIARSLDSELVPPTAFVWMEAYRGISGFACNNKNAQTKLRSLFPLKHNAFRKTFATMLTSLQKNQQATMLATGHTSLNTLKKHYEGAKQPRSEAEAYFAVYPKSMSSQVK